MSQEIHQKDVQKLLTSKEGQELIKLLNSDGGETLRKAGEALKAGNEDRAKKTMEPLLQSPQIRQLMSALEKAMRNG